MHGRRVVREGVWQEWIEAIFRLDADSGDSGDSLLAWGIVAVLFAATLTMARAGWRRRTTPA
jgi:hypothetical protein